MYIHVNYHKFVQNVNGRPRKIFQQYTESRKKRHTFYICDNLVRRHPILPIIGKNIPHLKQTHSFSAHHIPFHSASA